MSDMKSADTEHGLTPGGQKTFSTGKKNRYCEGATERFVQYLDNRQDARQLEMCLNKHKRQEQITAQY